MEDNLSLSELNGLIQEILEGNFMEDVWVVGEIAEFRAARSGHCYLDLIEKQGDATVARIRANIWSFNYRKISSKFFNATGAALTSGMKILCRVKVQFHPVYGISLVVQDVDPNYALGELERSKKELLERLIKEGLNEINKSIEFPFIPKRVALISSENAAGYEDFMNQINSNSNNYLFEVKLFNALMQGEKLGESIIEQLRLIEMKVKNYDLVVILRGGGAAMDLNGFNNYELCKTIAHFPIPIVSGIGHERDHTLVDEVAHTKLKTPTAVAEFLIDKFLGVEEYLIGQKEALFYVVEEKLKRARYKNQKIGMGIIQLVKRFQKIKAQDFNQIQSVIQSSSKKRINHYQQELLWFPKSIKQSVKGNFFKIKNLSDHQISVLRNGSSRYLEHQKLNINQKKQIIQLTDPINVIKRGYAIIKSDNEEFVKSMNDLEKQEAITIRLMDGIKRIEIKKQKNGK